MKIRVAAVVAFIAAVAWLMLSSAPAPSSSAQPAETAASELVRAGAEATAQFDYGALPPGNVRMQDGRDEVLERSIVAPRQDDVGGAVLTTYLAATRIDPGATIVVHASLMEAGEVVPAPGMVATLVAGTPRREVATSALEASAGFAYTGKLATSGLPEGPGTYDVYVKYGDQVAAHAVDVGRIGLRTTGGFADRILEEEDGRHLIIEVEAEAAVPGQYLVAASVYAGNEAVGSIEQMVDGAAGRSAFELEVYGGMLCDAGRPGPYTVRYLSITDVNGAVDLRDPAAEDVHTTAAYPLSRFGCGASR